MSGIYRTTHLIGCHFLRTSLNNWDYTPWPYSYHSGWPGSSISDRDFLRLLLRLWWALLLLLILRLSHRFLLLLLRLSHGKPSWLPFWLLLLLLRIVYISWRWFSSHCAWLSSWTWLIIRLRIWLIITWLRVFDVILLITCYIIQKYFAIIRSRLLLLSRFSLILSISD